jgi:hypothetical protein
MNHLLFITLTIALWIVNVVFFFGLECDKYCQEQMVIQRATIFEASMILELMIFWHSYIRDRRYFATQAK